MAKLNDRCRPPCWCLSEGLPDMRWSSFPNNAQINNRIDLNLGETVYISIYIPASCVDLLDGYDFQLWCLHVSPGANQPYACLKRINKPEPCIDCLHIFRSTWRVSTPLSWYSMNERNIGTLPSFHSLWTKQQQQNKMMVIDHFKYTVK